MKPDEQLATLASQQWGVFSRRQALDAGVSEDAIDRRLHTGEWVRVQRRVYRFRGAIGSWHQTVRAATLSLGAQAMASHATAAFLWNLDGMGRAEPVQLDFTLARGCKASIEGAVLHRSRLAPARAALRHGIAVTPLARTLYDLAGVSKINFTAAFDSAVRQYDAVLLGAAQELRGAAPNRPESALLARTLAERRGLTDSGLESDALTAILGTRLPRPETQYRIRGRTGVFVARADLAWPAVRVAVFLDSRLHHLSTAAFENDRWQSGTLAVLGWRDMRVTSKMLRTDAWLHRLSELLSATGPDHPPKTAGE